MNFNTSVTMRSHDCFGVFVFVALLISTTVQGVPSSWEQIRRNDERRFANKEHVSILKVREIVNAAGLKQTDEFYIDNLDVHSLRARHHVLLSIADPGTGKCLTLYVLEVAGNNYKTVWTADQASEEQNFCALGALGGGHAYVSHQNIIVRIPLNIQGEGTRSGSIVELACVKFSWDEKTYGLSSSQNKSMSLARYKAAGRIACSNL